MKFRITFFFCCCFIINGLAQKEAAIWYFGNNAGLDFNSGAPVALTDGALRTQEGCATISDVNGGLLFYTNGITVWNRNHQVMLNGTGLLGNNDSSQSAIIVPIPKNLNKYYIFTVDAQAGPNGMNYSEVDLTLDGGLGGITAVKNVNLMARSTEKITAVINENGEDIWVVGHPWESNVFYSYLVTATGLNRTPVQSITPLMIEGPPKSSSTNESVGYMKISPSGDKLGMCNGSFLGSYIFDFDNQTGLVSNMVKLAARKDDYGFEFSPSGKIAYVTNNISRPIGYQNLYQYNLNAPDVAASEQLIVRELAIGFALQLGIDGKIYGIVSNRDFLYSIENPDVLGVGCNFLYNAVDLNGRFGEAGLPPFIQSFFTVRFGAENFCLGTTTEFESNSTLPVLSAFWDFGDGATSSDENPSHTYASAGDYTVNLTVTTSSGVRTETKDITISKTPIANTITAIEVCSIQDTIEFDLSMKDVEVLGSQSALNYSVAYFSTQLDAETHTNALPLLFTNGNATETIFAKVYATKNKECYSVTNFKIIVKKAPVLHSVTDWTVCDTDTDGYANFDLGQKDVEVLNGQDEAAFRVQYFESLADAQGNTNAVASNYVNTSTTQELFFRIHNISNPDCFEIGSFTIEVITGVMANTPIDILVCDTDNDGFETFVLGDKDLEVLGSQNAASMNIDYYASKADAEARMNPLDKTSYINVTEFQEILYVRIENKENVTCYDTTSFKLQIDNVPVLQTVSNWGVCDADNDGIFNFDLPQKDIEVLGSQSATDFSVWYYQTQAEADARQNEITGAYANSNNPETIYYRIENKVNMACYGTGSFSLEVFNTPVANEVANRFVCDTNGTGVVTIDLNEHDSEILGVQDATTYSVSYHTSEIDVATNSNPLPKTSYTNSEIQETIYARVQHSEMVNCYDMTSFTITVNPLPQLQLEEEYVICSDNPNLTIDGGDFETWQWLDSSGNILSYNRFFTVTELGAHSLRVTQTTNGIECENTVSFAVVSSDVPEDFSVKNSGFSDRVTLEIEVVGLGDFEYSVDGTTYQNSNLHTVYPGTYTVYVRDKLLCRTLSKEVLALGYQKFFTPNGDSSNEYWNIFGAEHFPNAQIFIYDRVGKLVKQMNPKSLGWDGTYLGKPLPESDYWFSFQHRDGKKYSGHFTLKR